MNRKCRVIKKPFSPTELGIMLFIQEESSETLGCKMTLARKKILADMLNITVKRVENAIGELVYKGYVLRNEETRRLRLSKKLHYKMEGDRDRVVKFVNYSVISFKWHHQFTNSARSARQKRALNK